MSNIILSLIFILPLLVVALLPVIFGVAGILKIWYKIREKNMKKLAKQYSLQFTSNTPSFKQCIYQVIWPYALKEDWKTNYIEGNFRRHKIFICDNLFSGPRVLWKPLNEDIRRTVIQIDNQEIKGKEFETQFSNFQDGALTSTWELRKILKDI